MGQTVVEPAVVEMVLLQRDDPQAGIIAPRPQIRDGAIRGGVVHQHEFDITFGLLPNALDGSVEVRPGVVGDHQHGNATGWRASLRALSVSRRT
jgi:hypothetical protein